MIEADLATFDARPFRGATMVSGGLPCPSYSVAGKQMGAADQRDLFAAGLQGFPDTWTQGWRGFLRNDRHDAPK